MLPTTSLNPHISTVCPFLSTSSSLVAPTTVPCCNVFHNQHVYTFSLRKFSNCKRSLPLSFQPHQYGLVDDEERVLGDCLVFEEGIFDDPYVQESLNPTAESKLPESTKKSKRNEVKPENLIPDNWLEAQKEINITKKERRKLAQEVEFGSRVEKRRLEMRPIETGSMSKNVAMEDFVKYREEKLKQLKPIVLDSPVFRKGKVGEEGGRESESEEQMEERRSESSSRVAPRNPKWAVYGGGLDDITEFFNSSTYDPNAVKKPEGMCISCTIKLFIVKLLLKLNIEIPFG